MVFSGALFKKLSSMSGLGVYDRILGLFLVQVSFF
jgi:hypothetical protein